MKPAIERLEHWLEVLVGATEKSEALNQARLALAEVKGELVMRSLRAQEQHAQGQAWRELVTLCEHGSVCELGFWQAGNRRWFAQVKLMSGVELDARSGETPEEAVANAVALMAERDSHVEG